MLQEVGECGGVKIPTYSTVCLIGWWMERMGNLPVQLVQLRYTIKTGKNTYCLYRKKKKLVNVSS